MAQPNPARQLPSLLIIDDDPISREVMAMMLGMYGFAVTSAESGEQALTLLGNSPCEVILMDTQMPGLSGAALIKALRRSTNARIIGISGSPAPQSILEITNGFMLKPVEPDALAAFLDSTTIAAPATVESSSPMQQDDEQPDLVDPVTLAKLRAMMSAKALREIYTAVAADLKPRLETLQTAMEAGNAAEVSRIAHSIKGGCAMVGLSEATQVAAELEISDTSETWSTQLTKIQSTLCALEGMLISDFPV